MDRALFFAGAMLGASSLLLIDSAIKGAALLLIATVVVLLLRRDSAATRHFVWLVAVVGLLVVPAFSAVLPQWRVLPAWAVISTSPSVADREPAEIAPVEIEMTSVPVQTTPSPQVSSPPFAFASEEFSSGDGGVADGPVPETREFARPLSVIEEIASEPDKRQRGMRDVLPVFWAIGFAVLMLRLLAARLMLWSSERRGTLVVISQRSRPDPPAEASSDRIVDAFQTACRQLGVRRPVSLLIHSERTIPVVWGIIRIRLLLPESAYNWSEEQLQSVLLHELGHIKRRDSMTQLLAQIACALHWFNPAVWFASWRMHVERERACDDLVLANGVKPSAYAEHLLDVATRLSPAKWTQACGLAMARKSSLEDRLAAVLSQSSNRRSVSSSVSALALLVGFIVVVPVAMLSATDAVLTDETVAETTNDAFVDDVPAAAVTTNADASDKTSVAPASDTPVASQVVLPVADEPSEILPKHEDAHKLFRIWQANARTSGKIPGAQIGRLGEMVKYFNQLNKDEAKELVAKFEALLPRFDATVDWSQADAVALLDDVTAVHRIPVRNTLDNSVERAILTGEPLPAELTDAPWGKPAANGLRVAWHLSPRRKEHRLGSALKSRILVHNSGQETVFFIMPSWQQSSTHTAHDADDKSINVSSTYWTTMATLKIYRLAPGAYCETPAPAIGVGASTEDEDWANIRPGAWVEAKAGDDVRLTPGLIEVRYSPGSVGTRIVNGRPTNTDPKDAAELWDRIVTERLDREMPLPPNAADREQLLRRVVRDLFGVDPDQGEIDAYVTDQSPGALHPTTGRELLKGRVMRLRKLSPFTGTLPSGDITFRVLAADPEAANRPRVATGPGFFNLADKRRLHISQSRNGDQRINSAEIRFYSSDKDTPAPKPYAITLPEGRLTYGIAWDRDATELWVVQKGMVRRYDFSNPAAIKETRFNDGGNTNVPERFREAMKAAMDVPGAPVQQQQKPNSTASTKLPDGTEERLQWGEPVNGLRAALIRPPALGGPESTVVMDFQLVIQNVSNAPLHFVANTLAPNPRSLTVRSRRFGYTQFRLRIEEPSTTDVLLQPREITLLDMVMKGRADGASVSRNLDTLFTGDMTIEKAPPGAWTGTLVTAELHAAFSAHGLLPKHKDAREVFKFWNQGARLNRTIPGGLIGLLSDSVTVFTTSNPTWKTTPQLLQLLPRLDANRDWEPHDVVALLDEVAAIQVSPVAALLENERAKVMRRGKPLPKELASAPWGEAQPNGLRLAWLLEPQAPGYRIGTALKSRILIHNSGKNVVVFQARNWHQSNDHKARDAQGADINVYSMRSTMRTQVVPFRLSPGEFVELPAAGIGVGPRGDGETWKGSRVGSWIEAKPGDDVMFQPVPIALLDDRTPSRPADEDRWWLELVTARLQRELPVPMDDEVRKRLVYHVGLDLGTSNSDEIVNAFLADHQPTALDTLAKRLATHPRPVPFAGSLRAAPTRFTVLPAGSDAAK